MRGTVAKLLKRACKMSLKKDEDLDRKFKRYKRMWDLVPRDQRFITRRMLEGVTNVKS